MPFSARCVNCGYVVMANRRKMLDVLKENHDSKSHKHLDSRWTTVVLTHKDYGMLLNVSKLSAFWKALLRRF